jgi:hypothetical protein
MHRFLVSSLAVAGLMLGATLVRAADEPKAIVEKAVKAMGGLDKLGKNTASVMKAKGMFYAMGLNAPWTGDFWNQYPGQMKMTMDMEIMGQKFTFIQVLDGDKAWRSIMGMTMEVTGDELDALKLEAHVTTIEALAPLLTDKGFALSALGDVKVNDKPAVGVKVAYKGFKDVNIYFDKDTGLLAKTERRTLEPMTQQEVTAESFYSEYKVLQGVKQPTKFEIHYDGKKFLDGEVVEMKYLPKLEKETFAKP